MMMMLPIIRSIIEAQDDVYDLHGGNPNLIEFPKDNFAASFVPGEKRIELSPRDDSKTCTRIRSLVNDLRNQFRIAKVVQLGMNTFNVVFDPSEDFDNVTAYVKQNA